MGKRFCERHYAAYEGESCPDCAGMVAEAKAAPNPHPSTLTSAEAVRSRYMCFCGFEQSWHGGGRALIEQHVAKCDYAQGRKVQPTTLPIPDLDPYEEPLMVQGRTLQLSKQDVARLDAEMKASLEAEWERFMRRSLAAPDATAATKEPPPALMNVLGQVWDKSLKTWTEPLRLADFMPEPARQARPHPGAQG